MPALRNSVNTNKNNAEIARNSPNFDNKVRISLDLSPELYETISALANNSRTSKSDVLRKAIALMEIAVNARAKGEKIALVDQDQPVKTEIVGL